MTVIRFVRSYFNKKKPFHARYDRTQYILKYDVMIKIIITIFITTTKHTTKKTKRKKYVLNSSNKYSTLKMFFILKYDVLSSKSCRYLHNRRARNITWYVINCDSVITKILRNIIISLLQSKRKYSHKTV